MKPPIVAIEDDIPIPPQTRGTGASKNVPFKPTLPLTKMQIGQSIFIPASLIDKKRVANRLTATTKRVGYRYAMRVCAEQGQPGVRVWRVK